ncbi:B12-binding domain-containing radical SAM protein [Myxococcota bacterium]|nr:B12-binding domain-containing radical SAM protein [Myxococcota bacterium]
MKVDIVVVYVPRYARGHARQFVPPVTGIHLAALCPPDVQVRVVHQQAGPVPLDTDADLVCLSFFTGFAHEAWRLAAAFRARGKRVVAGGPHATFWPEETLRHCDAVVLGEAESAWLTMLRDAERGRLQPVYRGEALPLSGLPTPRYDLLPDAFFVRRVLQATRGCPFSCSFCTVPGLQPGFRVRPVDQVLRDVAHEEPGWTWWQRKVAWFWDDNLLANRRWSRALLDGMKGMDRWWLTQASIDITRDPRLLDALADSGCIGIFLGIESLRADSLAEAGKRQNKVAEYRAAVDALHARGICVMAGFIAGFDHDDEHSIVAMADELLDIGVDVPFLSVLTPFKGTPLWDRLAAEDRLLLDRGWGHHNGYNVAFRPARTSPEGLLAAHRALWRRAFSPAHTARRLARTRALSPGAALMSATMNGFYGRKALTGNLPVDMSTVDAGPAVRLALSAPAGELAHGGPAGELAAK